MTDSRTYGLLAELTTPDELLAAVRTARRAGYRRVEAYSPFPVEGLVEALELGPSRVPLIVLAGGLIGGISGYLLQYWVSVLAYPINVGGRPFNSWPAFVPVTFEMTILGAALFGVIGMLALNGLPLPYHPLFNLAQFGRVTRDRFFLCIEASDPRFDLLETRRFLESLGPSEVLDVPE
jgi:hypothetical protein